MFYCINLTAPILPLSRWYFTMGFTETTCKLYMMVAIPVLIIVMIKFSFLLQRNKLPKVEEEALLTVDVVEVKVGQDQVHLY